MISIRLIPDGAAEMPVEARDHGILWDNLSAAAVSDASPIVPSDVGRVVTRQEIRLRLDGALADHSSTTLDNLASAITANVSGVKEHPDGWTEVQE